MHGLRPAKMEINKTLAVTKPVAAVIKGKTNMPAPIQVPAIIHAEPINLDFEFLISISIICHYSIK